MRKLDDLLVASEPLDVPAVARIDIEELIAQLESIYSGDQEITKDQLLKLRDLKSAAIVAWDIIRKVEKQTVRQSPINISQRGWYAVGLMEEILYRNPNSPMMGDLINLHSAASSFCSAGDYERSLSLLDEALKSPEIRPRLRDYLQNQRLRVTELMGR